MMNEIIVSAATLLIGGNALSAAAWAKERVKSKLAQKNYLETSTTELDKLRASREEFVRINDDLMFERFEQLQPELLQFLKNHAHLIPVSALEGFQPTDAQIRDWVVRNNGRLPLEFRNSLLELIKPGEHKWEIIFKSGHGDTVLTTNKLKLTGFVEKCKKCSMIHRYHAPVSTRDDGFFFGTEKTTDRGCRG
jgi:hypothetical protein